MVKNLKKVLATLLASAMLLSSVAFASSYSDVKSTDANSEAIQTLSELGILKGDDQGKFNPGNTITRAEFAAVVVRALGMGDPSKTETSFTDVKSDHWGSGYIKTATQLGVIKGYGDGKFGPEDPVTYEQAVKMLVAALGYTPKAEANGGYPTGYMVIAAQEGITDSANGKIGDAAKRAIVAQLTFNALDVDLMEQTGFGKDPTYETQDGKTLLNQKFDVTSIEAVISDARIAQNIDSKTSEKSIDLGSYKYTTDKGVTFETGKNGLAANAIKNVKIGDRDVANMIGYKVTAYVRDLDGDNELIAIVQKENKNNESVIAKKYIGSESGNVANGIREYKDTGDVDSSKGTAIRLATNVTVVENAMTTKASLVVKDTNGNYVGTEITKLKDYIAASDADVKFVDNDNDGNYDFVFVEKQRTVVVDEVSSKGRVSNKLDAAGAKLPSSVTFDDEKVTDRELSYSITLDGKEIGWKDLKEYDVLTILTDNDNTAPISESKIIKATVARATAEGKVTDLSYDDDNKSKPIYTVDGKEYKLVDINMINDDLPTTNVEDAVGNEYTFYLNAAGKVAYVEKGKVGVTSNNYAYLYSAAPTTGLQKGWEIRLFNSKGEWVNYQVKDKFTINGKTYEMDKDYHETYTDSNNVVHDAINTGGVAIKTAGITGLLQESDSVKQLITYHLDSNGKVDEINSSNIFNATKSERDDYILADTVDTDGLSTKVTGQYKESTNKLGSYFFNDSTVIFAIDGPANEEDSYKIITESAFKDDDSYTFTAYNSDSSNEPEALVAYNVSGSIPEDADFMVINTVKQSKDANDDTIYNISGYVKGDIVTVTVDEDAVVDKLVYNSGWTTVNLDSNGTALGKLAKGDVIQYNNGGTTNADKVRVVFSNTSTLANEYLDDADVAANKVVEAGNLKVYGETLAKDKVEFTFGEVSKYSNGKITFTNGDVINVGKSNFVGLTINGTKKTIETDPTIDLYEAANASNGNKETRGSLVLIRTYDDGQKDVLVFNK